MGAQLIQQIHSEKINPNAGQTLRRNDTFGLGRWFEPKIVVRETRAMIDSRSDGWLGGMKSSGYAARSSNKDKVEIVTQR